jgi:hypothetical protein
VLIGTADHGADLAAVVGQGPAARLNNGQAGGEGVGGGTAGAGTGCAGQLGGLAAVVEDRAWVARLDRTCAA